jgi:hypothetical protein
MPTPTSHYTQANSLRLHYLEAGTPDPNTPPILLLHGFPTSSHLYRNVIPTLAKTHRVIALDLPGYGLSDKPLDAPYDFDFFADIFDGFLDALDVFTTRLVVRISALWTGPVRPPRTTWNPSRSKLRTARLKLGTITTAWSNLEVMYSPLLPQDRRFCAAWVVSSQNDSVRRGGALPQRVSQLNTPTCWSPPVGLHGAMRGSRGSNRIDEQNPRRGETQPDEVALAFRVGFFTSHLGRCVHAVRAPRLLYTSESRVAS